MGLAEVKTDILTVNKSTSQDFAFLGPFAIRAINREAAEKKQTFEVIVTTLVEEAIGWRDRWRDYTDEQLDMRDQEELNRFLSWQINE